MRNVTFSTMHDHEFLSLFPQFILHDVSEWQWMESVVFFVVAWDTGYDTYILLLALKMVPWHNIVNQLIQAQS